MAESSSLSEKELDDVQQKLANRMVKSGEWQRIQDVLSCKAFREWMDRPSQESRKGSVEEMVFNKQERRIKER
ncbi:hypothetical protein QFC20_003016 [Naganishia adeliensis]|uniref:Uncharacterized protein n=1 Tax=Naganishia adeliensis TaxID=92952 RepID=A0ACC2WG20_9TREE|nr:hypothetical protein QFC20_003016 [Naganishia adeliensis]